MTQPLRRWSCAAAVAAAVGGLAACGAGTTAATTTAADRAVATASPAASTATLAASTATPAATTATPAATTATPAATTATPAATTTTTNTASATGPETVPGLDATTTVATTPDRPGTGRPTVLLGDMNTPEQFIIGALYQDALQAQGYTVELSRNIGPTSVSEAAIAQGSLDIYPEYLNIYDTQVAGYTHGFGRLSQALRAGRHYADAHGETLLSPTPFSDTAGIAVLASYARIHHLATIADLRRVESSLTLGSPSEFSTDPAGLPALERAYHFLPAVTTVVNIGFQYDALRIGSLQAAYAQTTDWQLSEPVYTDLRDSRHVLGFGNVVPVVSSKVLDDEGPAFAAAINQVDALLTTSAIRGLAAELEADPDPAAAAADVAQEFLQGNGILPPPPWSTLTTTTSTTSTTLTLDTAATAPHGSGDRDAP